MNYDHVLCLRSEQNVHRSLWCDGIPHCKYEEDEMYCEGENINTLLVKLCMSPHCKYEEDEMYCEGENINTLLVKLCMSPDA